MTTLTVTFDTPAIDAQIARLAPKQARYATTKLQQAKDILAAALEAGTIFNVDMVDAKDSFSTAICRVLEHVHSVDWPAIRAISDKQDPDTRIAIWDVTGTSLQLNHVASRIRKAEKLVKTFPGVESFLAVCREALPFAQAVEELKAKIVKGRKPLENPKPVDLSNTGTCAICQHQQKLNAGGGLVHHGFAISDGRGHYFGFRSGSCFGVRRTPYELSNEANIAFIAALKERVIETGKRIASLEAGEVTQLGRMETRRDRGQKITEYKTYRVGDDLFPQLVGHELASANHLLTNLQFGIERQELLAKSWVAKPLPGTEN